jgi:PAS domain S-box-containing protein
MKIDIRAFILSLLLGVLLVAADVFLDNSFLYHFRVGVLGLSEVDANEMFMRLLILVTFIVFGAIVSRQLYRRKVLEKQHSESTEFLQQMLDSIPAPVFYKDSDYVYTGCNVSFEKYLGRHAADIVGKTVYELAPQHLADVYHQKDVELMENPGVQIYESNVAGKDGREMNVIFHKATLLDRKGNVSGLIGVILDITELRKAETAKQNLIDELREALGKVRILSGFLPICASCKKIRDDSGYWQQIEIYIRDNSNAEFSHSICPDCAEKLYEEYERDRR